MKNYKISLLAVFLLVVSACGPNFKNIGRESDPTTYFTLKATHSEMVEGQKALPNLLVGVGPVSVAEYLDRTHIVVRESATKMHIADFDRWAAGPEKEIQRVVVENLAALLGSQKIATYPWRGELIPDRSVEISVEQFEFDEETDEVHLVAAWQIYDTDGDLLIFRRAVLKAESDRNYNRITKGLSDLTGELSLQIAASLRALESKSR